MENEEKNIQNPVIETAEGMNFDDIEFTEYDFELRHQKAGEKIHDEKFQTKPTTFVKDAFRRFCKNKASVVGGVIIGVLLLSSFLSFLSPYDITTPAADIAKLMPKLFDAGTGWWDGTQEFYNKIYDEETKSPYGVKMDHVVPGTLVVNEERQYYSSPNEYAKGGYYRVLADTVLGKGKDVIFFNSYRKFNAKASDELKITFVLGDEDGVDGKRIAEDCTLYIVGKDALYNDVRLKLYEAGKVPGNHDVDVSAKMTEAGFTTIEEAQYRFEFTTFEDVAAYILIESVNATCGESASAKVKTTLEGISFNDANWVAYNTTTEKYPESYWQSNGIRLVYKAYAHLCSYRYDQYKAILGERDDVKIGWSLIDSYIKKGWCEMSNKNDVSTFKLTHPESDECPIRSLSKLDPVGASGVYQYEGIVLYYRYKGYSAMPKFVFGTDASGYDMLTLSLSSLKNSLFLAIITSAICLVIGLVWGSVSGYFGGNVDLFMERITDILSGVPWIVVMTLVMLLLGRNFITFGIAICLTGWIGTSSRTRTQFYRFKGREYVLASRTLGASDARLIFRHILPNGLGTIVTGSVLMIPSTIFSEATISYLGLGLQGTSSFGVLLSENQINLRTRPALIVWPSIIISLLMISFNLFGNGLRDALNPTLKGGEQ
ncbi:MAG: ABC transporter permease [Bacilli bacterium]|nr:ABC transporter permease [Bacilli bacterium]